MAPGVKEISCPDLSRRYNIRLVLRLLPTRIGRLLACFALLAAATARPQSPASRRPASAAPSAVPDAKKARQAYQEGLRAEKQEDWQAAFGDYARAAELAPGEREYLLRRDVARSRVVRRHVERAERDAVMGRFEEARRELRVAIAMDPGDSVAQQRLEQLAPAAAGAAGELPAEPGGEIHLRPQPGKRSFDYRGETQGAYQEVARKFGVTPAFDVELHSRPVRFRFENLDFETAMRVLGDMTGTFWRPLTPRIFFVAEDTPQKRRQYDASVVRTVLLRTSATPDQMTEILRVVREIAGITRSELDTGSHTLTLRDSPQAIAVATQLIEDLEKTHGEMVLEIEILEVDRTLARQLGLTPPETAKIITLSKKDLLEAQQSVQGLINVLTRLFGQPSSLSGVSASQLGSLIGSGQLGLSALIPPLVAFGGGRTTFLATLPGAATNLSETLSLVRQGRRILLRAEDGKPATFFVGDRFPITLALLSPSLASAQFVPGVSSGAFHESDFPTGSGPSSVVAGDFNGDGRRDLALTNHTDNSVSILLGSGNATFGAKTDFPTGRGPAALVAGDFNGDGHLDLAVANQTDNTVSILLGRGDGTFGAKTDFPTGASPVAIVAADFDGDGHLDLAVANQTDNTVSILLGRGDGTFGAKTDFPTGTGPVSLVASDFNADGKIDLAVADQAANTVTVLLGRGDGTFGAKTDFPTGMGPLSVATADFNGDRRLDLAIANHADNTVSILLGRADGTFGAKTDFVTGTGPSAVTSADFNIDGRPDLAVADQNANTVSVLLGIGDGTFAPKLDLSTGTAPVALTAADFNGDNRPDLAVANQSANTVTVIQNTANFIPPTKPPQAPFPGSEYVDLGLKVRATPRLHPNDEVTLKLEFEIRSLSGEAVNGIPVISNRTIEQMVRLRENETSALAGILEQQEVRAINGLPGFAALTGAGYLTGNRSTQENDTELLILVTPRLVRFAPRADHSIYAGHGIQERGFMPGRRELGRP